MPSRGEGRPFILPAEMGGILAYFDKIFSWGKTYIKKGIFSEKKRNLVPIFGLA